MTTITDCLNILFRQSDEDVPPMGANLSADAGSELSSSEDCAAEFRFIKKRYFKLIRTEHPDKGGDVTKFRVVQSAFEVLRCEFERNKDQGKSFMDPSILSKIVDADFEAADNDNDTDTGNVQPWEFYEAAAESDEPLYHVELAKSGRARCSQTSNKYRRCDQETVQKKNHKTGKEEDKLLNACIGEGEVRVGSYESLSGSYTRWHHLECWRVPSKLWQGFPDGKLGPLGSNESPTCSSKDGDENGQDDEELAGAVSSTLYDQYESALLSMNEVFLSGFKALPEAERREFIDHCMNRANWARIGKKKAKKTKDAEKIKVQGGVAVPVGDQDEKPSANNTTDTSGVPDPLVFAAQAAQENSPSADPHDQGEFVGLALRKDKFIAPRPGLGKCVDGALDGLRFVITGVFPELGGGSGLNLGKDKAKGIITSFGGKVTGSISGKTDYLLVGKEPGMSKVTKANEKGVTRLNLSDLKSLCEGGSKDDIAPLQITSFSSGFAGRGGLALKASADQLRAAALPSTKLIAAEAHASTESASPKKATSKTKASKKKKGGSKKDETKKPAAKKGNGDAKGKTKKQLKQEAKAATKKEAADNKAQRKVRAEKAKERKETPIEDLDWKSHLEEGGLEYENVAFLKTLLKHLGLAVSGKKAELLQRLRAHAKKLAGGGGNKDMASDEASAGYDAAMEVDVEGSEKDLMEVDVKDDDNMVYEEEVESI